MRETLEQVVYCIYQPVPHRDRVFLWANGENHKETIKVETFKKWIIDSGQEFLIPQIMKTLNTYSFFLWDKKNAQAFYLQPNIHSDDFKKPLLQKIKRDTRRKKEEALEEKDPRKRLFDQFTMINLDDAKKMEKL